MKDNLFIKTNPQTQVLMIGNYAIARGAIEAGVDLVSAYPGTPSSEIVEALNGVSVDLGFHSQWSINEKVAFDVASGAALVGARALVAMKSAGLSVAMDTFTTLPYSGIKGGMVIVVCDDPDAHFSSTEHDSRPMAKHAEILCLEPMDASEAKEMVKQAFELSEKMKLPVMVRSVTRISHGSSNVTLGPIEKRERKIAFNKHFELSYRWNVYGPPGTRGKHEWLVKQLESVKAYVEDSSYNQLALSAGSKLGIIASGLGSGYASEAVIELGLEGKVNLLKLGTCFPLPTKKVAELLQASDKVLIVEEGADWIEGQVREIAQRIGAKCQIVGKGLNEILPPYGELNTDMVIQAFAPLAEKKLKKDKDRAKLKAELNAIVSPRSSTLCAGCPHMGSYWGLRQALLPYRKEVNILNGDIGCYEQAGYGVFAKGLANGEDSYLWPADTVYEMLDTLYVMGSALGMAQGESLANYKGGKIIAIAGDSTFFHACMPALANCVWNGGNVIFMVLDNRWTAMTGHQASPTTGIVGNGCEAPILDIVAVSKALGVKNVLEANAYDIKSVKDAINQALTKQGVVVVVVKGECRLQMIRADKKARPKTIIDENRCNACGLCLSLGCPALGLAEDEKHVVIDQTLCNSCGLCFQVCNRKAILIQNEGDR